MRKSLRLLVLMSLTLGFLDIVMGSFGVYPKILTGIAVVASAVGCMKRVQAAWYVGLIAAIADIVLTFLFVPFPWGLVLMVPAFAVIYMLFKPDIKGYLHKKKTPAPVDDDGYFACEYSSGGGMEGGRIILSMTSPSPGKASLNYDVMRYNGDERKTGNAEVPDETVAELKKMFDEYGIRHWKLKKSDMIVLDAPSVSVSFTVGKDMFSVEDDDVLPKKGSDVISRVYDALMGIYLTKETDS